MATASQARSAIRSRLEAGAIVDGAGNAVPLRWQNEAADSLGNVELPDTPSPFVYTEILTERSRVAAFGGGRGNNLHRNPIVIESFVFVPKGEGLDEAELIAEQIGALLRSYRDSTISLFEATVYQGGDGALLKPPGLTSDVGNYYWAACEASGHYDRVG